MDITWIIALTATCHKIFILQACVLLFICTITASSSFWDFHFCMETLIAMFFHCQIFLYLFSPPRRMISNFSRRSLVTSFWIYLRISDPHNSHIILLFSFVTYFRLRLAFKKILVWRKKVLNWWSVSILLQKTASVFELDWLQPNIWDSDVLGSNWFQSNFW